MRAIKVLIVFFPFLHISSFSYGQRPHSDLSSIAAKKEEVKMLKAARKEFDFGNYDLASEKYMELLKIDSTNPTYNFEQAQTLYNNYRKTQSIKYYENAIRHSKDSIGEAYYFLANAYHLAAQFEMAQKNYKIYQTILNIHGTDLMEEEEIDLKNEIKHKIEMCDNGQLLYKLPPADKLTLNGKTHSFRITGIDNVVNTEYDDYGAVLSANDSLMYFTSRRDGTTGRKVDWDDKFFEDIYMSQLGKKGWENSIDIGAPINTKMHEAMISLSADGKTIYFYRGVKQGTFYYSTQQGNIWTKPAVLFEESDMNTNSWETSFFGFAVSGSELYVVSERDSGIGGRDIYIANKQSDGKWGALQVIGGPINTQYDEDAPFITSDGKTMYFSSKGHNSMGGFDIFKSERHGDKWSEPVNLGLPFNTPGDDIYFIVANKSDRAYFSSSSLASDGTKDMDIYEIDLCDDIPETILAGTVLGITNGSVSVAEKESGKKIGDFNIANGKYSIRLAHGRDYRFTWNLPSVSVTPISADISIPSLCKVYDLYQELGLEHGKQEHFVAKNAFFNIKNEAGVNNYSDFLSKMDPSSTSFYRDRSLYSEIIMPVTVILATTPTVTATTTTAATPTVTATTTTAGTPTVTATTTTAATPTVTATTTTAGTPTVTATTTTAGTPTVTATTTTTATPTVTATTTTAATPTVAATTTTATSYTTTTSGATTTVTTISVNNILFDYDKSNLRSEFTTELDKVADFLKSTNKKARIEVAGHTDAKGDEGYNLALSKRRANAVTVYLVSKGISKNRINAVGYGESKSVAPNENPDGSDNPEGRAKNRRTEIVVVQ